MRLGLHRLVLFVSLAAILLYGVVWPVSHRFLYRTRSVWILVDSNSHTQTVMTVDATELDEEVWHHAREAELTGMLQLLTADGQKLAQYTVANGLRNGPCALWSADGQQIMQAAYASNQLDSSYVTWHASGIMSHTGRYSQGQLIGEHTSWYENGRMARKQVYTNGLLHGTSRIWDQSGKLLEDAVYHAMKPIHGVIMTEWDGKSAPVLHRVDESPTGSSKD